METEPVTDRYQKCPAPECGDLVDTWLAGTSAAHRTPAGVMHAACYVELALPQTIVVDPKETPYKGEMMIWKGVLHRQDCQHAFLSGDYRCEGECLG